MCFQFTNFLVMIERIYTLCLIIIIKSDVWSITHCLGLGHETMVCALCLFVFLWICDMPGLLRGTFVSWWYLPRIWTSDTDMQHYYHAALYVFLYSYEFVICLDCFVGHSCPGGICPESGPLTLTCSITTMLRCMSFCILMNLWYAWIASWDIRVLVVFAPNLDLWHWHAALLPC